MSAKPKILSKGSDKHLTKIENSSFIQKSNADDAMTEYRKNKFAAMRELKKKEKRDHSVSPNMRIPENTRVVSTNNKFSEKLTKKDLVAYFQNRHIQKSPHFK